MAAKGSPKGIQFKIDTEAVYDTVVEEASINAIIDASWYDDITTMPELYRYLGIDRDRFRRIVDAHGIRRQILDNLAAK